MPDATFDDYQQLAGKVIETSAFGGTIMPQPEWGQDAALIGFLIDRERASNARLRAALVQLRDWDMLSLDTDGHGAITADAPWARTLIDQALE